MKRNAIALFCLVTPMLISAGNVSGQVLQKWESLYSSVNLTNHLVAVECSPGDPTTNCPCSTADVALVVHDGFGEVIANPRHTNVYVNAIGAARFMETLPNGDPIELDIFRYSTELRLPLLPSTAPTQQANPQAAHIMIQMWDGTNRVWQANQTALEATLFWCLNPWQTNDYEKIFAYTTTPGATGILQVVDTGIVLPADTNWHSIEMVVDFKQQKFVSARIDDSRIDLSHLDIARLHRPDWGIELLYHITQESCSTYPGQSYSNVLYWSTYYRNVQFDRLRFDLDVETSGGELFEMKWDSEPYMHYQVSTSRCLNAWGSASGILTGDGTAMSWSMPCTNDDRCFYRLELAD